MMEVVKFAVAAGVAVALLVVPMPRPKPVEIDRMGRPQPRAVKEIPARATKSVAVDVKVDIERQVEQRKVSIDKLESKIRDIAARLNQIEADQKRKGN